MASDVATESQRSGASIEAFAFDVEGLARLGQQQHQSYVRADPFPHAVLDGLVPERVCDRVLEEFPRSNRNQWIRFHDHTGKKLASRVESQLGPFTRHVIAQFNSAGFLEFLEKMTGIDGLIPDPHLFGGGLHQIQRGGFLKIHADFNRHERLHLDRRLNLLLFLNRDWDEAYGGQLELWDREMAHCVKRVLPVCNRAVVFSTTSTAYHGHPNPLTCPEGRYRRSMALYYYTSGRPAEEIREAHTTLYQERPGETVVLSPGARLRAVVKRFVPSIIIDAARALRGRRV